MIALLRETIEESLASQGESALIVWYDPGATLQPILQPAIPQGAQLLPYDGSYLALRFALESKAPLLEGRWIVYIPERPLDESWLRDWELLGVRWEVDLLDLLSRKANVAETPTLVALLRRYPTNARQLAARWDELMTEAPPTEGRILEALLALGFGLPIWHVDEGLRLFLSSRVGRVQLERQGLWDVWRRQVAEWLGWSETPEDEDALRSRVAAAVLLGELVSALPKVASRLQGALPSPHRLAAAGNFARVWREHENAREAYLQTGRQVEREYELRRILTVSEALLTVETFSMIDALWRQELRDAVTPDGSDFNDKARQVGRIAESRSGLFWALQGEASFWEPIALGARLFQRCQEATGQAANLSRRDDFVDRYSAEDGWWQLDFWALELAAKAPSLLEEERTRFAYPAWRAYGEYIDQVNRSLAKAVEREGWAPSQTNFWREFVSPHQRIAVILADALRYDLAQWLKSRLPAWKFQLAIRPLQGVLPSVTELGMSALLPGAEEGLTVGVESGRLRVAIKDEETGIRSGRLAWFEGRLGNSGRVVALDELETKSLTNIGRVVVLSREVDEFGTFVADLAPGGLLDMVKRIERAIHYLAAQGYERFVITADHGFLFMPPSVSPHLLEAPKSAIHKRRFLVGGTAPGCFVERAKDLGYVGDVVFAFPVGRTVFALPGEVGAFLHGGLSLQEAIVPVLEGTVVAAEQKVSIEVVMPAALTSRIAVLTLRARETPYPGQPRRVLIEIGRKKSEAIELSPDRPEATVRLTWLEFDQSPPLLVTVRLIDADSLQRLQESTVPVQMVV